jgi:hypothetical protein
LPAKSQAQGTQTPEIVTDRPTVTPSPLVVPPNYVQAENGLALRKENRGRSFNAPQTQIRLGVLPRMELRLAVPNYFLVRGGEDNISGVADMAVGTKIQLGSLPGKIDLAVIPGFSVPTGSASLTTHAVDPFVQTVVARRISANWTLSSAQSIFIQTEAEETQVENFQTTWKSVVYQPTFTASRKLGPHADVFSEFVGNFARGRVSDQIIDIGGVYRFRRNQQLGTRIGVGLTTGSSTAFVEFGYSLLLGKIIK